MTDYEALDLGRLPEITVDLLAQLDPDERERALRIARQYPGSQKLEPLGHGWFRTTIGQGDEVCDLGDFHVAALRPDIDAGSMN